MTEENKPYRVLARKYRPQNFDELIGQDTLVRTLKNAIEMNRVAHAFMLTGVRGVGKTTTARIIAKALNYTGPDGKADATTAATDDCKVCQAISEDRHPDVIEMDAASRTGVDDIREILDGVRYAPTEARYKIYIIDEVHMLSKQAFNALLKTLEEPPPHVKFIFATTEIRKVPITVLSRCQRFDLSRVDVSTLIPHFKTICEKESFKIDEEALSMIARAADGSVRDGLSLLDRAMALSGDEITGAQVKDMLGLADKAQSLDVLDHALAGRTKDALEIMDGLYKNGHDPVVLMQDLLDLTHILTRLKAVPGDQNEAHVSLSSDEMVRAGDMAGKLSMPSLGKTWQILLKGLSEVQTAPIPQAAAEMVIIRLVYAANLPDPQALIETLTSEEVVSGSAGAASTTPSPARSSGGPAAVSSSTRGGGGRAQAQSQAQAVAVDPQHTPPQNQEVIASLEDVVAVLEQESEFLLASHVYQFVHVVKLQAGRLDIRTAENAPPKMAQDLSSSLRRITGQPWMVSLSGAAGAPTLAQRAAQRKQDDYNNVLQLPVMRDILKVFPEGKLVDIQDNANTKG